MYLDSDNVFRNSGIHEQLTFDNHNRLLTTLEIQVSQDQICKLDIRQFDDPYLVALNFCTKYQLNQMAVEVIEKRIQQVILQDKNSISSIHNTKEKEVKKKYISSKKGVEIGTKLYQKGLKSLQKSEQLRVKTQMDKQAQQQKELTFKPKINEVSQKIVEMRKYIGGNVNQKRTNPMKKIDDQLQQCTFKPEINKTSKKIVNQRFGRNEEEIIQKLYYDSVRIAAKKKKVGQINQFSYKPTINEKSRLQVRDTFMQRLQKDQKLKKQKQVRSIVQDQQCSFTPQIGRPPKVARNKQNLPIGDYLLSKNYQSRSKSQISHQYSTVSTSTVANKNSDTIYQNLVKKRIQLLFELLDGNADGLISPDHINIQQLSLNSLELLKPFFKQMQQLNAVLDERNFTKAMLKLLQSTSQHLKGQFISQRWRKPTKPSYSFKPQLNTKSTKLAQQRVAVNLYQQGIQNRKKKQVYTALLQARKQQQQLHKCTFKPLLNSTSKLYVRNNVQKRKYDDSLERMFESSQNQDF